MRPQHEVQTRSSHALFSIISFYAHTHQENQRDGRTVLAPAEAILPAREGDFGFECIGGVLKGRGEEGEEGEERCATYVVSFREVVIIRR